MGMPGSGTMNLKKRLWFLAPLLPILLVALQWATDFVHPSKLVYTVPKVVSISWLETNWLYAYLHLFTFIPVFLLSFDRNVHYYRKWKHLFPAIGIVAIFFIAWDVFFTIKGVWGFNESYFLGKYVFSLPVEEWLFFIIIPFSSVFIYECLNFYVKIDWLAPVEKSITTFLVLICFLLGLLYWNHMYTATTFLLTGSFLLFHLIFIKENYRSRFYLSYLVILVPFLLVNGVLTGGYTKEPVVIYNPEEFLGVRLTSVPVDDAVYGFLLIMGVITIFEYLRKRAINRNF